MTLEYSDEFGMELPFDGEALARIVAEKALDYEECPYETEISLTLVSEEEIQKINNEFRDIDRPTDVLSFPMLEFEDPGYFREPEDIEDDCFNPETGELMLGDIVISTKHVYEQATSYGHSEMREFAFLVAHSMLHLMGYDHMSPEEATVMEKKQREILEQLEINR